MYVAVEDLPYCCDNFGKCDCIFKASDNLFVAINKTKCFQQLRNISVPMFFLLSVSFFCDGFFIMFIRRRKKKYKDESLRCCKIVSAAVNCHHQYVVTLLPLGGYFFPQVVSKS